MNLRTSFAAVVLGLVVGVGCSSQPVGQRSVDTTTTTTTPKARPGLEAVYAEIAGKTSCSDLQAAFDQAETNHERGLAQHRSDLAKISTSYMAAADDRMRQIGCY